VNDTGFVIPPKIYDFLKYLALVVLPAVAALILGLGVVLHWYAATGVAGVVTLVDTFLGAILGKSASNFKAQDPAAFGDLVVMQHPDGDVRGMRVIGNVENPVFQEGGKVYLNVKREQHLE